MPRIGLGIGLGLSKGPKYGPEMAIGWDTNAWWDIVDAGWTFNEGVSASCDGSSGNLTKNTFWTIGKTYKIIQTHIRTAGTIYPPYDGSGPPESSTTSETVEYDYLIDSATHMVITSSSFNGTITALSIKEIL
jgi:hypothetical protein